MPHLKEDSEDVGDTEVPAAELGASTDVGAGPKGDDGGLSYANAEADRGAVSRRLPLVQQGVVGWSWRMEPPTACWARANCQASLALLPRFARRGCREGRSAVEST